MIKLNLYRKHLSLEHNATLIGFVVAMLSSTISCWDYVLSYMLSRFLITA